MSDLSPTIRPETADDAAAIDRLHERTFGPGRVAKTAYRIREGMEHTLELSFTARIGTLLVGSVRLTPICIGTTKALLLGPLTVEPPFRERGIGQALIARALDQAKATGHRLVVLRPAPVRADGPVEQRQAQRPGCGPFPQDCQVTGGNPAVAEPQQRVIGQRTAREEPPGCRRQILMPFQGQPA